MTVALGLVCSDGVLVASDSMASYQAVASQATKVFTLANLPVVWTSSGSVYVIEEVAAALKKEIDDPSANACPTQRAFTEPDRGDLRARATKTVVGTMKQCYESALPFGINTANTAGAHPFFSSFLLLGWTEGSSYFLEFDQAGQVNWHDDVRFYAIGSGFAFAHVATALMAHYLEGDALPLNLGKQVAYRTIETTCDVSAAHVGLPVQLAIVDDQGARVLDAAEVEEVQTAVAGWKQLERDTLKAPGGNQEPEALPTLDDG